jgi:hypothetical protein
MLTWLRRLWNVWEDEPDAALDERQAARALYPEPRANPAVPIEPPRRREGSRMNDET